PPRGERFDRLAEQLEIIEGLWTTPIGQTYSFHGKHYELMDSPALPKPAQSPHPPLIVGGKGPRRTPALAARFADAFNVPFAPLGSTSESFQAVRSACTVAGRDPASLRLSAAQELCCGRDDAQVRRRAEVLGADLAELRERGLAGTPAELVDKLGRFAE